MITLAPGFGNEGLNPLDPLSNDPTPKKVLAPGFGKQSALPSPSQQPTESPRLSKNYIAQADLENYMAGNQSGLELFGKALGQSIPNALLGTVEAVSYLGDIEQMIDKMKGDEAEYTNWLADAMKKAKESIAQDSPLKVFQTAETREGFAPGDATWWASHTPDVLGSALSLLIPAAGVAGLVGKGAKALKMAPGATNLAKGIGATVTSRYAESTMEAASVYERAYKELTEKQGMSPELARLQAGQQASNVWNTNWVFAIQDFMQYSTLLKGFSSAAKGSIGKSIGEIAKQTLSEAGEEAGQFISAEEGFRAATEADVDYFGSGFKNRLYEYVRDPEFKSSALLGAFGGAVFTAAGPLGQAAEKSGAYVGEAIKSGVDKIFKTGIQKEKANYVGDTATSQVISDVQFTEGLFRNMKEGKLVSYKQDLENLKETEGLDQDARKSLDNYTQDVDFIADEQAKLKSSQVPADIHNRILAAKLEQRQLGRLDNQLSEELTQIKQEVVNNKELSPDLTLLKELQVNLEGYRQLAKDNPQFQPKLTELEQAFDAQLTAAKLGFPNVKEELTTSRDNDLFQKSFQLYSTKEKMGSVKKELTDLTTPEGIARVRKEQADKAVNEASIAVLKNPNATKEEILQAAANTNDPQLKSALAQKHQHLVSQDKVKNENDTKMAIEAEVPELPVEQGPGDIMPPEFDDNFEPVPDTLPDLPIDLEVPIPFAGGITPEQAQKWGGLSKSQVDELLDRVDIEQKVGKVPASTEQKDKDAEATESRQRTTVPAWLKEVDSNGVTVQYTNNITGELATPDKIFATDPQTGQLLANTPIVKVGDKVTLKLENDFPWTLTPGFKPDKEDNFVINVYIEGNNKPIKQLPSADNPRLADQKVVKALRDKVIKQGSLVTTITSKNVGTIRNSSILHSLEVLESDFVGDEFKMTEHNPILGFIDFNGNPTVPALGSMRGITDDVVEQVNNTMLVQRSNDLSKLKGKVVTFRTSPLGDKRMVGLEPRQLNEQEVAWLTENLPALIKAKDYTTLNSIVHIPQHPSGVYSTKGGKKPDVLKLDRRRFHIVNTTKTLSDILIPIKGKDSKPVWIIIDSRHLENFLGAKPFSFRVLGPDGNKSELFTDHPKQGEIVEKFKKLLSEQFKNVNKDNLNSEIRYTNPINPDESFDSYYDYLVKTNSVQTNLPGSKTLGVGDDSSYSFNQVAIYLDPNPETTQFNIEEKEEGTIIVHGVTNTEIPAPTVPSTEVVQGDDALDEFFGPDAKLKPTTEGKFKLIGETELQWFKDSIGKDFLQVAEGVDRFIAANGVEAFGQYYNSLVTVAEFAPAGTAYHEALHFFADPNNGLVTKKQSELINSVGEEKLAEQFELYKASNGQIKPKEPVVSSFFKKIWMMIKNLLGFKSPIQKLFYEIDNLNLSVAEQNAIKERAKTQVDPGEPRFKKLPGFKFIKQQVESIQAFSSEVIRITSDLARQKGISIGEFLTDETNLNTVLNAVKSNFERDFESIKQTNPRRKEDQARYFSYLAMGIGTPAVGEESYVGSYEDVTTVTGFPSDGFKSKVLKDLARYGFSVRLGDKTIYTNPDEEDAQSVENIELKQEDEAERLYDVDHTLINPSKSMSQRVRLFLATIPEPIIGTDEVKKTIFGTTKFLDFRKVDGNLALKLRDSINPITRLTELAKKDAISKVVLEALMNEKNKGNIQLFNEFAAKYNRDGYYKKTILYGTKVVPITRPEDVDPQNPKAKSRLEFFAKTIDSDRASSDRTLHNRWREEGVRKKITDTDGTVNLSKAESLYRQLEAFKEKFYTARRNKSAIPFDEVKNEFTRLLSEIGVTLEPQVWMEFDSLHPGIKYKKLENLFFGVRSRSVEQLFLNTKDGRDPFEGSTVLTNLAKISSVYVEDSRGGAYRNDSGNQENPINWPSPLTEFVNNIRSNPKEVYEYYTDDNFYANNELLKVIKGSSDKIELNFTSVSRRNDDAPKEFEERGEIESVLMRLTTFYNNGGNEGFFFTGTPADKTKQPIISLPKYKGVKDSKDFLFTVLKNTMNNEVVRIQRVKNSVAIPNQQTPLPGDISNYKNGDKFLYIPGLNSVPNLVEQVSAGEINKEQYTEAVKKAEQVINDFIETEFTAFKGFLIENDIITSNEKGEIDSKRIPKGLLDGRELNTFLQEFFYNDLAWRMEVSKVIMGDVAFYKSTDDYFKRAYQTVTPGIKGYSEEPKTVTRGIYGKQMKINTPEYLDSLVALGSSKEVVSKYEEVNKTDAQSVTDVDTYKILVESLGQWSKDHEIIYKIAWSKGITIRNATRQMIDEEMITEEEGKRLRGKAAMILMQPLKPFQFNNRKVTLPDGKVMIIKEQFKDSITPITPELTNIHKGYKDLLSFMKNNKIGIMSAEDTTKVGLYGVITDISQPVADWQKRVINLEDFRFPQLLPDKKKQDIKGTQLHKLILGNIDDKTMYKVGRTNMLGKTIKEKYNDLWLEKIQNSSKELQKRLGVTESFKLSEDPAKRKDQLFKLKTTLEQELLSRDVNENYQDLLDLIKLSENKLDFTLPISFPAFGQKFQSILSNLWKKNVLAQDSPGYSAVNLADFGVGYDDELKFVTNEGGELVEAEIGLPIDYLSELGLKYGEHILPNGRIIWDKLNNNQQESLQFILYRIPTSNKSSMLPVRVVKIVPSNLNNVVMIPGELTIQQGLDFDVDKSQLLRRVLNKEGKVDNESVDTQLFNIYWGILTNKAHTQELLTPLATPTLEAKFKYYLSKGLIDLGVSSSVMSSQSDVKAEIRNKDGKAEIGIASRFNTGHSVLQNIKDYVEVNAEIEILVNPKYKFNELGRTHDANGTLISENHAEGQQAALDSAKNPLLAYFHIVTGTMAAFHTMIDFGIPLPVVTDFFMQPVVKEWTKFFKQEGLNQRKATEKLLATYPAIKNQFNLLEEGKIQRGIAADELTNYLSAPIQGSTAHDARVLQEFLKIMSISSQLGKINNVLSIDTFQDATGIEALESFVQQKNDITNPDAQIRVDARIFDLNNTPPVGKRLAAFYHYGVENALNFSSQFFPSAAKPYQDARNYYAQVVGETGLTDKNLIKQLNQFIDYYNLEGDSLLSRTLVEIHPQKDPSQKDYRTRWALFSAEKSMWKYIDSILSKYPALKTNEFLRNLETQRVNSDQVQIVGIRNTDNNSNKTEVTNGWYELLHHPSEEVRGLGHDLVRFATFTTGFNFNQRSMFELVPVQFWVESGLGETWRNIANTAQSLTIDKEGVVVNFVRHNFKNIERFPEFYGRFSKEKGFQSNSVINAKIEGSNHITEFTLVESDEVPPRFMRFNDNQIGDYRLYESDPNNPMHFKEVQPSGEKNAFYEVSADGRAATKHPKNQKIQASPNPWLNETKVSTAYPLIGYTGRGVNSYVAQYLPEEKNNAEGILKRLQVDETDVEAKKNIEVLLRNIDKLNVPVELEELQGKLGVFETYEDGTSAIKINPKGNVKSEDMMRHILLHELNHSFSVGVIQNPTGENQINFVRNLDRIVKESKFDTDSYEFIAELASNSKFRQELRGKGLWSRILRAFRKLLGMTDQYDKLLDQYYSILDNAEELQKITPSEFAMKEEEVKPVGKKRIDLLQQMLASLKAREDRLRSKGRRTEATKLAKDIKVLEELSKTKRNEAVVKYLITVEEEMGKLQNAYNLMAKAADKINPDALFAMREQLVSYKLLDAFSDQIHLNPDNFVPEGGNSEALLKSLDQLRADVHKMSNATRRLAIQRFASVIKNTLNDPNITVESIVDQLEVADRDIDWLNRWTEVGMEMDDVAVRTAHKMLTDNSLSAYRAIQDDLYLTEPKEQESIVAVKTQDKDGGYHWERRQIKFTSVGMFKALTEFEAWVKKAGKNPNSIVDKFALIIDQSSLEQNDDGVHLIAPWSKAGKMITSIPKDSESYPLRQFYETFVMGYLKSQEKIPAYALRPGLRIPSIQRSMLEGIINESGADKLAVVKEAAIDSIRKRYDETDFKAVDENGKPQEYIPVRYIAKQDGKDGRLSTREVSLDIASTLPLFIHEMYSREGLEKLHADLELGKLVLGEREVMKTQRIKGKGLIPFLTREREGITLASGKFDTIKGEQSKSFAAYDSLLRRFLYGQTKKSEGDVQKGEQKFSGAKIVDTLLGVTGFKVMFGNLAIPLTNGIVGEISMAKEVIGGNLINASDYKAANKFFSQVAMPSVQDLGRREKKTKAGRVLTYFNPLDNNRPVSDIGVDTNWMRTIWNTVARTGNSSIEFYLGAKAIGATFNRFKAKNASGKEVSFYEAIEVSKTGKVQLADGYTYKGKKTISPADINEVRNYALRVYQLMNGVYNKIDKPAANEYIAGRLLFFMRNWLIPGIQARWKTKHYDERLQKENEGHYLSALVAFNNTYSKNGFIKGTADALRILTWFGVSNPELLLLPNELTLSQEEKDNLINMRKANIRKTLFELYLIMALTAVMGLAWDDDDESYTKYMLARIRREVSTFYSPSTLWDVLRSPTVALNLVDGFRKIQDDTFNSLGAVIWGEEQPMYEQGPYKGEYKLPADLKRQFGLGFEKQFDDLDVKTRIIQRGGIR